MPGLLEVGSVEGGIILKSREPCDLGGLLALSEELLRQNNSLCGQIGENRCAVLVPKGVAKIVFADEKLL